MLNLVAGEGEGNRQVSVELARGGPGPVVRELRRMRELSMPHRHALRIQDLDPGRIERVLLHAYEACPADYTSLLAVPGVGAKGLRALALVAELTYGEPASVRDPASYAFAHGGKDGTPFPVDRVTYDATIESLRRAVAEARVGSAEKVQALKRLAGMTGAPGYLRIPPGGSRHDPDMVAHQTHPLALGAHRKHRSGLTARLIRA